jgi:hypothetical protein
MSRGTSLLLSALSWTLLAPACEPKAVLDTSPDTESPYVYKDTGAVEETAPPVETGDSTPPVDTSPPVDTDDTGEPVDPIIADLLLYPGDLAVFPGAEFSVRLVEVDDLGVSADVLLEEAELWSDDEAIAAVDPVSGLVSALAEGSVELWAAYGGLETSVTLEVIPPGNAELLVVDADTLAPIEAPFGSTPDGSRVSGDSKGTVLVPVDDAGPITLTAWSDDHIPVSIVGTVSRRLVVPVRSQAVAAAVVPASGAVAFDGVPEGEFTDVVVGLAASSVPVHPLSFDLGNLVADDRTVSIWGIDVDLPSNLFVGSYVETWEGLAPLGDFGVWSLAGAVPIDEITAGLNGDSAVIDLLVNNLDRFVHGWSAGWTGLDGEPLDIPVAPDQALSEPVVVEVPPLSLGFSGDEQILVLITDQASDGTHAVVGLGQGTEVVDALRIPSGTVGHGGETWALAMAQVDGLGSGYGMALSAAQVESGQAQLPDFPTIPSLDAFSGETREYAFESDPGASLVRIEFEGGGGQRWDLYFAPGPQSGTLSKPQGYSVSWGETQWTLSAVHLAGDTFEGLVTSGSITDAALAPSASSVGRVGRTFGG